MQSLAKHFLKTNLPYVLENSSLDCHVKGLNSVMLFESDDFTARIYVATEDHCIWQNGEVGLATEPMTSGFHPHRSPITILCASGTMTNKRAVVCGKEKAHSEGARELRRYLFDKSIEDKDIDTGFRFDGSDLVVSTADEILGAGDSTYMRASDLHTIYVPRGKPAAWFVFNGRNVTDYQPVLWTNFEIESASPSGLYRPMGEADLRRILTYVWPETFGPTG